MDLKYLTLFVAGIMAGVINAVAGGGTLMSFPALVLAGVPAVSANATSTAALLWGIISAMWSYRKELATQKKWAIRFAAPCVVGGLLGGMLLLATGETQFRAVVPYLILFAAILFTFQKKVIRFFSLEGHLHGGSRSAVAAAIVFQFFIALYGGYFGAGIGILMLASLVVLGHESIHEMNSLKVFLAFLINISASIYFLFHADIYWLEGVIVAGGAVLGGFTGPLVARKVGPVVVRRFVSVIGFSIGFYFLFRQL